jgi:hypothetical protein
MSYLPLLKAVLPYIGPIVSAAAPMLTRKSAAESGDDRTQMKQIAELQNAVEANGRSVRLLAEQFQVVVETVDARQLPDKEDLDRLQAQQQLLQQAQSQLTGTLEKLVKDTQTTKALGASALIFALAALATALLLK